MAVPAPNLQNMTIPQLLQALVAGAVGSAMHQQAMFMLQFRIAEKQAEAAAQQAAAAQQMVAPTQALARLTGRLVWATWALAAATVGLIVATIVPLLWGRAE